jgi:hypothetical protein
MDSENPNLIAVFVSIKFLAGRRGFWFGTGICRN